MLSGPSHLEASAALLAGQDLEELRGGEILWPAAARDGPTPTTVQ